MAGDNPSKSVAALEPSGNVVSYSATQAFFNLSTAKGNMAFAQGSKGGAGASGVVVPAGQQIVRYSSTSHPFATIFP